MGTAIMAEVTGMAIAMGIDLSIGDPIPTRNQSTFHHLCTMSPGNRPASVSFFRSIFVGSGGGCRDPYCSGETDPAYARSLA